MVLIPYRQAFDEPSLIIEAWFDEDLVSAAGVGHATSGALAADAATVVGGATHLTLHTSSGALAAGNATVAGAAAHWHTTSGALASGAAAVSGVAAHLTLHTTTGALSAGAATVAGSADHAVPGGSHATSGGVVADAATIAGAAAHLTLHAATGALASGSASLAGAASGPAVAPPPASLPTGGGVLSVPNTKYWREIHAEVRNAAEAEEIVEIMTALCAAGVFE